MANQIEELEKRGRKPAAQPRPVEVPVSPPAYTAAGLPVISLGDLGRSVAAAGAGAVVTAIFITSLREHKVIGSLLGLGIGTAFVAASPIASVPYDLGIGMLAGATGWIALHGTGRLQE